MVYDHSYKILFIDTEILRNLSLAKYIFHVSRVIRQSKHKFGSFGSIWANTAGLDFQEKTLGPVGP